LSGGWQHRRVESGGVGAAKRNRAAGSMNHRRSFDCRWQWRPSLRGATVDAGRSTQAFAVPRSRDPPEDQATIQAEGRTVGPDAPIVPHRQALESAAPAPRPPHSARIPASSNAPDRVPRGAVRQLSLSLWGPPSPVDGVQPIPANHLQAAPQRPAPQRLSFASSTRCRISCTHRRAFQPDLRWPVHCPEEGLRKKQRHLSRHLLIVGLLLLVGATTVAAQSVKFYATGDIPVANGGMLNDYTYTQASDDQYEDITEAKENHWSTLHNIHLS